MQPSAQEIAALRARLAEAEGTLQAIREGEVDAVVVSGSRGDRVFSLTGAESVYRQITETMSEAAFILSLDGRILFCNRQFSVLVRTPQEQVISRRLHDFVPAGRRNEMDALLAKSRAGLVRQRVLFQSADGSITPAHISAAVLRTPDGPNICCVATDLTELEESASRLRLITDNISEMFWMTDVRFERMLFVSPNCRAIFGAASAEVERKPSAMLKNVHPGDRARAAAWLKGLRGGTSCMLDYRLVLPSGAIRHIRQNGMPVTGANGRIASLVGVVRDVTEQVRAETERANLAVQVQEAKRLQAIGQLAGGVAHDFNNKLAVIVFHCGLILGSDEKTGGEEFREQVRDIRSAADEASALIRHLLAIGRKQVLRTVVVSPNDPIRKMTKLIRSALGGKIKLSLRLAKDPGRIRIDLALFEQAVLNLIANSRDAMPDGGKLIIKTADLTVPRGETGVAPGKYVRISISDTGVGIPKDVQNQVFDPFFTTKPKGEGIGLGLPMVYGTIKQHGGEISLHSEPGMGTTMRLCFKRVDEASASKARPVKPRSHRLGRGERILLVEDEPGLRKVMAKMLRYGGYSVASAASADEALELFGQAGGFALVVTDVIMPGLDGAGLAARLRERAPGLPIIFYSGYAEGVIAASGTRLGKAPLLTKPIDPERLFREIRSQLDAAACSNAAS